MRDPSERLRHHVTGAIKRGEKSAIVEKRAIYCAVCNEECSTRADGSPRLPLQHKWGPVAHGDFVKR